MLIYLIGMPLPPPSPKWSAYVPHFIGLPWEPSFIWELNYLYLSYPTQLIESFIQGKNIPVVLPSSPIWV